MTDVAFYLSFAFNVLLATGAYFVLRGSVKSNRVGEAKAKSIYSAVVVAGGVLCGVVLFPAMVALFRLIGVAVAYGHGEIVIAAIVFNLMLSMLLLLVGRILLGWQPFSWS